ncbi:hypothetical protein ACFLU6_13260 [Acidobacteriota bacterium]
MLWRDSARWEIHQGNTVKAAMALNRLRSLEPGNDDLIELDAQLRPMLEPHLKALLDEFWKELADNELSKAAQALRNLRSITPDQVACTMLLREIPGPLDIQLKEFRKALDEGRLEDAEVYSKRVKGVRLRIRERIDLENVRRSIIYERKQEKKRQEFIEMVKKKVSRRSWDTRWVAAAYMVKNRRITSGPEELLGRIYFNASFVSGREGNCLRLRQFAELAAEYDDPSSPAPNSVWYALVQRHPDCQSDSFKKILDKTLTALDNKPK